MEHTYSHIYVALDGRGIIWFSNDLQRYVKHSTSYLAQYKRLSTKQKATMPYKECSTKIQTHLACKKCRTQGNWENCDEWIFDEIHLFG